MARFSSVLFVCVLLMTGGASAKPIDVDLAIHRIEIDHNFQGLDILLFGARNDVGRIVAIARGPQKDFIVRKKERVAGIWVNRRTVIFQSVPAFYTVASSSPLPEIQRTTLLDSLELGLNNINIEPLDDAGLTPEDIALFRQALVRHQQGQGLYPEAVGEVVFWGETLFRSQLLFPKTITGGWYTAEVYLFNDGELMSAQTMPVEVRKTGLEALLYDLAHRQSLFYGVLCVAMAIAIGWLGTTLIARLR